MLERKLFAGLFVVILVLCAGSGVAGAHTEVESASPGPGTTVTEPVSSVELTFTEPLADGGVAMTVTGPDGSPVAGLGETVQTSDRRSATVAFDPVRADGDYVVGYDFAAEDGHSLSDRYRFSVALPTATTTSATAASDEVDGAAPPPNIIPRPNSGQEPQDAGDRGGSLQTALFVIMIGGIGVIAALVVRESRRARAERGF